MFPVLKKSNKNIDYLLKNHLSFFLFFLRDMLEKIDTENREDEIE